MKAVDHNGKEYPDVEAMCKAYGITPEAYDMRLKLGWSVEAALTTPAGDRRDKPVMDHKGNTYPSIAAMCKAYGVSRDIYDGRRKGGWTLEAILTTPVGKGGRRWKSVKDHKGVEYSSTKEMCSAYGITIGTFNTRRENGWSLEKALTAPVEERGDGIADHKGNRYDSVTAMCNAYNLPLGVYFNRILRGWSLEKALTEPLSGEEKL